MILIHFKILFGEKTDICMLNILDFSKYGKNLMSDVSSRELLIIFINGMYIVNNSYN